MVSSLSIFLKRRVPSVVLIGTLVSALGLACGSGASSGLAHLDRHVTPEHGGRSDASGRRSNMMRQDYVGSRACQTCHVEIADSFARSAMHNMTRDARTAKIVAPFDGTTFRFKEDSATFSSDAASERGTERTVSVDSQRFGSHVYRVTKVIGGHHREDFAGVEMRNGRATGDEEILPVSYVLGRKAFRYKGYSVMTEERPAMKAGPVWRETCIFCHNTTPCFSTILGALAGPGASERTWTYQGTTVDRFLPSAQQLHYQVNSSGALRDEVSNELRVLRGAGGAPETLPSGDRDVLAVAVSETRSRFDERHLIELGIGCESCHGGSRDHAANPKVMPSFHPSSEAVAVELPSAAKSPAAERAQWIDRTCARCHQVLFSGYPHTWEGGLRSRDPGGSHINSSEARDLILGGCASELSCTRCHDAHGAPKNAAAFAGAFANAAGDQVCTSCHASLASDVARARHSHHRAEGEGSHCVACHMPRKNMGLDGTLTRYHRIASPTEARKVEGDRPLECALCHGDKTVESMVSDMERMWNKHYDRAKLTSLYGRLDVNVLVATLGRGHAHEQAVAMSVLGDRRDKSAAPALVEMLDHKYPIVREYARDALEKITGRALTVDLNQDDHAVVDAARAWLAASPSSGAR